MIYNQKHAIFVALAGLFTSASAAPAHHAKSGHTSELISPGLTDEPEKLWSPGVTKDDYPEQCMTSWELFNRGQCWCFTGCALDCNHGGWKVDSRRGKPAAPGVPGKDLNPQMCEDMTDDHKKGCEELTCDLKENCKDVADNLKPGLDQIESTGGYQCSGIVATYGAIPQDWGRSNSFTKMYFFVNDANPAVTGQLCNTLDNTTPAGIDSANCPAGTAGKVDVDYNGASLGTYAWQVYKTTYSHNGETGQLIYVYVHPDDLPGGLPSAYTYGWASSMVSVDPFTLNYHT